MLTALPEYLLVAVMEPRAGSDTCPFCAAKMIQAAIIDSDNSLDLRAEKSEPSGISLNWADGNNLAVSRYRNCQVLGQHAVFSYATDR